MHPINCSWIVNNVYYKSLISINNNISAGPITEFLSIASDTDITQVTKFSYGFLFQTMYIDSTTRQFKCWLQ